MHPTTSPSINLSFPQLSDTSSASLRDKISRDGFVVLSSVLSSLELQSLRSACYRTAELARSGSWPYIRTLPKQFPPWPSDSSDGIWGVQHLLHPDLPDASVFATSYFGDTVINAAKEILDAQESDLMMELYNLLVRPDADFELRWHRDDISASASQEEELQRLSGDGGHTQWNLALYSDSSLIVVPGSHRRARTKEEREADPYEKSLPGMLIVELNPGDIVFYNNNILHRGLYSKDRERMTLHGSIGHKKKSTMRARNVLQHGVEDWVKKCDFSKLDRQLRERADGMRERLIEMGRNAGDVGFYSKNE